MDTNPTSIRNMLLGLEMVNRVEQSFVKFHFHRMTIEYSNWLVNKIADKEVDMDAMRKQFLRDNRKRHEADNYEFKRRATMIKYLAQMELLNNQIRKDWRKNDLLILALNMFIFKVDAKLLGLGII